VNDSQSFSDSSAKLGDIAARAGLRRVHFIAWRDLSDPEAGGSEIHAHEIAKRWAQAGMDITFRTSYAPGLAQVTWRDGYRVVRKAGRYAVFPRAAIGEIIGRYGRRDALIEIWNGMPFFSPLWARGPHLTFLHHVHAEMWNMTLPNSLALVGKTLESKIAPRAYRSTQIVTLSDSSKRELVEDLGFVSDRVSVVEPGIDGSFTPGAQVCASPLVVAVGRLVPVKKFDRLIHVLARLRRRNPTLRAIIVGEGYERPMLESLIAKLGAEEWIELPGRVSDDELINLYRQAWVVASTSAREGWGMTLTEAAACGTPAVVTDIAGHRDAVENEVTGFLVTNDDDFFDAIDQIICDPDLRSRMSKAASSRSERFRWDTTARRVLEVLAVEAQRHRAR
jgi:glycosyltransferase involved in cell wall biosynthesis